MKTQMSKVLTLGFSLIFSFSAAGNLKCHECSHVSKDNTCAHIQTSCESTAYCYTQRLYTAGKITNVSRGCTEKCELIIKYQKKTIGLHFCCEEDFCNVYNAWI